MGVGFADLVLANDMTWDRDIAWLRSITTMKILIKGGQ